MAILSSQNAVGLWANGITVVVTASGLITRPLALGQGRVIVRVMEMEMIEVREIGEEREVRGAKGVVRSLKRVMDSGFLGEEQ